MPEFGRTVLVPSPLMEAPGKAEYCCTASPIGGGIDVALAPNFFVRGEYEYTRFAPTDNVLLTIDKRPRRRWRQILT